MASDNPDTTLEESDPSADEKKPFRNAIIWLRADGETLTSWLSGRDELVVGRDTECDTTLDAALMSRRHARIRRTGSSWFIEDLESRNGISLNGEAIEQAALTKGDVVRIGAFVGMVLGFGPGEEPIYELLEDDLFGGPDLRNLLRQLEVAGTSDLATVIEGATACLDRLALTSARSAAPARRTDRRLPEPVRGLCRSDGRRVAHRARRG